MPYPRSDLSQLQAQVKAFLESEGLSLDELTGSSLDVIVFGSRANGQQRHNSDLDLLIVGDTRRHKKLGKLDLIFVPEREVNMSLRRRTELFRHVEEYGVSLMHDSMLVSALRDDYAAKRKLIRLRALVDRALPAWGVFTEAIRLKYLLKFRRETQRYNLLAKGLAVPPTAQLDSNISSPSAVESIFVDLADLVAAEAAVRADEYQLLVREAFRIRHLLLQV